YGGSRGHNNRRCSVVEARRVSGSDDVTQTGDRTQTTQLLGGGPRTGSFVLIDDGHVAFAIFDFDRHDFVCEVAGFGRCYSFCLRGSSEFVGFLTGYTVNVGDFLSS